MLVFNSIPHEGKYISRQGEVLEVMFVQCLTATSGVLILADSTLHQWRLPTAEEITSARQKAIDRMLWGD